MHEGELAMSGRRFGRPSRLFAAVAALLLGALLFGLTGCSEESKSYSFNPTPEPSGRPWLFDLWGSGPDDVWAVGRPGLLLHWDGTSWSRTDLGTSEALTAVWGTGAGDVYVVGHKGIGYHFNGSSWSGIGTGTGQNLYDVGRGPGGETYICGQQGVVRRLAGGAWVDTPDTAVRYNPAGTATVDTLLRSDFEVESLTCVTDYAISGGNGIVLMTDTRPTRWRLGPIGVEDWINAGQGSAVVANNWLASDTGRLFRLQSVSGIFSWLEVSSPATAGIDAMWGDATHSWFVTRSGDIVRRANDGTSIQTVYDGALWLSGIWGSSASNIWACGYTGLMLHWNGSAWSAVQVPLPAEKDLPGPETDKFGRPLR